MIISFPASFSLSVVSPIICTCFASLRIGFTMIEASMTAQIVPMAMAKSEIASALIKIVLCAASISSIKLFVETEINTMART